MRGDRIFGLVMMIVALGYVLSARNIQTSFISDPVGPRVFPYIIGAVMMLCSLVLVLRPDPDVAWPVGATLVQLGIALGVLVGYAYLIDDLGFIVPTVIASGVISYLISPRIGPAVASGVGLGLGLFVLFKMVLGLGLQGLPPGWGV